jgi:hypothetical protein
MGLGACAWLESTLEMLVFGLPLFLLAMGVVWLQRLPPRPSAATTGPAGRVLQGTAIALAAGSVLGFGYIVYARLTDSGLVGWMDAVQARRTGKYSERLSFIAAAMDLLVLMGIAFGCLAGWQRLRGGTGEAAREPPRPIPAAAPAAVDPAADLRAGRRFTLYLFAALVAGIWAIGFPAYLWTSAQHRADVAASYEAVRLAAGGAPPSPSEDHVALYGAPRHDQAVVLREGRSDTRRYFVPVVAPAADPSEAVAVVVQFEGRQPTRFEVPLLARVDRSALPTAIAEALARGGVHLRDAPLLLTLVPSRGGKVEDRSKEDLEFFLGIAGMTSAMLLLMAPLVWWALGRRIARLEATQGWREGSPVRTRS